MSRRRSLVDGGGQGGRRIVGRLSEIFSNAENLSGVCPEIFENSFNDEGLDDDDEKREGESKRKSRSEDRNETEAFRKREATKFFTP